MALGSEDDEEHGLMALSRGLDYEQKKDLNLGNEKGHGL